MIKAEWTNKDSLDLQPTCNNLQQLATMKGDLISRADAIEAVIAQRHKAELSDYNFALGLAEDAIRHLLQGGDDE